MRPERALGPTDIFAVSLWKDELDVCAKWWQKKYHRWVFRPFLRFSFNVAKCPPPKGVVIEGRKTTFFWFENIGSYGSEDQADIACVNESYCYKRQPFNRTMPSESGQYSEFTFPRRKRPRLRPQPVLDLVIVPRSQEQQAKAALAKLNRVLDT